MSIRSPCESQTGSSQARLIARAMIRRAVRKSARASTSLPSRTPGGRSASTRPAPGSEKLDPLVPAEHTAPAVRQRRIAVHVPEKLLRMDLEDGALVPGLDSLGGLGGLGERPPADDVHAGLQGARLVESAGGQERA
jgi:hypothetical protein